MNVFGSWKVLLCTLGLALMAAPATQAQDPRRDGDGTMAVQFPEPASRKAGPVGMAATLDPPLRIADNCSNPSSPHGEIGGPGDAAAGDDFGSIDVQPKLSASLESDPGQGAARYQVLMAQIPAFNDVLRKSGAIPLDSPLEPLLDLPKAYPRE